MIFVGHLTATKRPERFAALVASLRAQGRNVRGLLVGDGPMEQELRRSASPYVELLGRREDVPELLRSADLFVFCSIPESEGMPGVLIEAALSGLPIVATEVPGVSDVVIPGVTGFTAPPDDDEALTSAVLRLVDDPLLRQSMGGAARKHAETSFNLEGIADRWRAMLEDVASRTTR